MRKIAAQLLALAVAGGAAMTTMTGHARVAFSADVQINSVVDFDAPLAAEGSWVTVASYGNCWHPRGVAADWRPYCNGQWVLTDNGWYWQSDEPFAWACYHYGSWTYDSGYGWVWVPGLDWAPAWVVWRSGGGYVGWAPCAPNGVEVGVNFFAFVPTAHFDARISVSSVRFNAPDLFRATASIGVGGRGPAAADIQRATGHEIRATPLQEVRARTPLPAQLRNAAPGNERPQPGNERALPPANERQIAPVERTPRNDEIAPSRTSPELNTSPRSKEQTAPGRQEVTPPAEQRTPRSGETLPPHETTPPKTVAPGAEHAPGTVAPAQKRPAEQPHAPAEQPKSGEEKHEP
jgi:hypothetical protein